LAISVPSIPFVQCVTNISVDKLIYFFYFVEKYLKIYETIYGKTVCWKPRVSCEFSVILSVPKLNKNHSKMHYLAKVGMFMALPFIQNLVNGDKYIYTYTGFMILFSLLVSRRRYLSYTSSSRNTIMKRTYMMVDTFYMKAICIYLGINIVFKGILRFIMFILYDKHILISTCISVSSVFLYKYDHIFTPYNKLRRMMTIYVCYIMLIMYNLRGVL
jgi:hypothetical protein